MTKGLHSKTDYLISIDEKPGIQALKRKTLAMKIGRCKRQEFEYERHGKLCLRAALDIGSGKIIDHDISQTNNNDDFVRIIRSVVSQIPSKKRIAFLLDNLRPHMSTILVQYISSELGFTLDLGKVRKYGILCNMESRRKFLSNKKHRIRFIYTPVHCSWLNPIENWFSVLQRQVLKHRSFENLGILEASIKKYISYYNSDLSKVIKWKFTGFSKNKPLAA